MHIYDSRQKSVSRENATRMTVRINLLAYMMIIGNMTVIIIDVDVDVDVDDDDDDDDDLDGDDNADNEGSTEYDNHDDDAVWWWFHCQLTFLREDGISTFNFPPV